MLFWRSSNPTIIVETGQLSMSTAFMQLYMHISICSCHFSIIAGWGLAVGKCVNCEWQSCLLCDIFRIDSCRAPPRPAASVCRRMCVCADNEKRVISSSMKLGFPSALLHTWVRLWVSGPSVFEGALRSFLQLLSLHRVRMTVVL